MGTETGKEIVERNYGELERDVPLGRRDVSLPHFSPLIYWRPSAGKSWKQAKIAPRLAHKNSIRNARCAGDLHGSRSISQRQRSRDST